MDEHRLDGNAVGGLLGEVFTFEMTMAETACDRCGTARRVGAQMAYVSEIGTVVRCASCDNALIRVARDEERGRYWLDLRGLSYLALEADAHAPPPAR
jgi:Family of unknown function (DUF6510)